MSTQKFKKIHAEIYNGLVNYLRTRPYQEVADLLALLDQSEVIEEPVAQPEEPNNEQEA